MVLSIIELTLQRVLGWMSPVLAMLNAACNGYFAGLPARLLDFFLPPRQRKQGSDSLCTAGMENRSSNAAQRNCCYLVSIIPPSRALCFLAFLALIPRESSHSAWGQVFLHKTSDSDSVQAKFWKSIQAKTCLNSAPFSNMNWAGVLPLSTCINTENKNVWISLWAGCSDTLHCARHWMMWRRTIRPRAMLHMPIGFQASDARDGWGSDEKICWWNSSECF